MKRFIFSCFSALLLTATSCAEDETTPAADSDIAAVDQDAAAVVDRDYDDNDTLPDTATDTASDDTDNLPDIPDETDRDTELPDHDTNTCGNGIIDPGETCDGNETPCFGINTSFPAGTAYCTDSCIFDTTNCRRTIQWGTWKTEEAKTIITDTAGNIFIAGDTYGSMGGMINNGGADVFISSVASGGNTLSWTTLHGGSGTDSVKDIAIGDDGTLYIAGDTGGSIAGEEYAGDGDAFFSTFTPSGEHTMTRMWGGGLTERINALDLLSDGRIMISGWRNINYPALHQNTLTLLFTPDGTLDTSFGWGSGNYDETILSACTIDGENALYAVGQADGTENDEIETFGETDIAVWKADPDGTILWETFLGTAAYDHEPVIYCTSDGIFVTATTVGTLPGQQNNGESDIFAASFSTDGEKRWAVQWGSEAGETARSLLHDGTGHLYVLGETFGQMGQHPPAGLRDIFMTLINATDGTVIHTKQWGSPQHDYGDTIVPDSLGNICVAGGTSGSLDGQQYHGELDAFLTIWPYWTDMHR